MIWVRLTLGKVLAGDVATLTGSRSFASLFFRFAASRATPLLVLSLTLAPAALGVPSITTPPAASAVAAGATANFSVAISGATGSPTYQWYRNGAALSGSTLATLAVTNVQTANTGNYTVAVTDSTGGVMSSAAALTLLAAPAFSALTSSPGSAAVDVGGTVTLAAQAAGTPAPTYQWSKSGATLAGQTAATLTISNAQTSDAGNYTVTATNSVGGTTSSTIALTILSIGSNGALSIASASGSTLAGTYDTASGALTAGVTSGGTAAVVAPQLSAIRSTAGLRLDLCQRHPLHRRQRQPRAHLPVVQG